MPCRPQRVVINEQMLREAIMIVSLSHTFFTCLTCQMRLLLFGLFHSPIS